MSANVGVSMNGRYYQLAQDVVNEPDCRGINRKGEELYERLFYTFTIKNPFYCIATERPNFSWEYLKKEFAFYCSGSNKLEEAVKMSKFWERCTDDGETINSNYGKLLLHDRNKQGLTQFEFAIAALKNNLFSKKAVMSIYAPENSYISNDNPCTMFLYLFEHGNALHMRAHMRSSDIWYGVPYDVPFFCAILHAAWTHLKVTYPELKLGTYTHYACNIHAYERNVQALQEMCANWSATAARENEDACSVAYEVNELFNMVYQTTLPRSEGMEYAWRASEASKCLKKKCGAALMHKQLGYVSSGHGGREGVTCTHCARDAGEKFHGDGCWSVHAEMRAIIDVLRRKLVSEFKFEDCTMYITHGPCDACMKLMDYVGIKHVIYEVPYKTDYSHWPNIKVEQEVREPSK